MRRSLQFLIGSIAAIALVVAPTIALGSTGGSAAVGSAPASPGAVTGDGVGRSVGTQETRYVLTQGVEASLSVVRTRRSVTVIGSVLGVPTRPSTCTLSRPLVEYRSKNGWRRAPGRWVTEGEAGSATSSQPGRTVGCYVRLKVIVPKRGKGLYAIRASSSASVTGKLGKRQTTAVHDFDPPVFRSSR